MRTRTGRSMRSATPRSVKVLLAVLLALSALAPRLLVAPRTGYRFDISVFEAWTASATTGGFADLYVSTAFPLASFPNYALLFYLFALLGKLYAWTGHAFDPVSPSFTALVKIPGILGDFLLAYATARLVRRLAGERAAWTAAAIILFHPAVFYVSAVWGQADSLYAAPLVLAVLALTGKKHEGAWAAWTVAALVKAQSVVLLPLVVLRTVRERGGRETALLAGASLAAAALVALPFMVGRGPEIAQSLLWTVSRYPSLTMNAMNVWWPVSRALGIGTSDGVALLPSVSAKTVGLALFSLAVLLVLLRLPRHPSAEATLAAAAALSLAFFLFPTEIHERYLYPAVPFLVALAFRSRTAAVLAAAVSGAFCVNLLAVLPLPWPVAPGYTGPVGESPWILAIPLTLLASFVATVRQIGRFPSGEAPSADGR